MYRFVSCSQSQASVSATLTAADELDSSIRLTLPETTRHRDSFYAPVEPVNLFFDPRNFLLLDGPFVTLHPL